MKSNREKTTGVMGFVVSILLHGIFFAACIAMDYSAIASVPEADTTEINQVTDDVEERKEKS